MSAAIAELPNKTKAASALEAGLVPLVGAMEIPLELVYPSQTNRRQVRNAEKDAELAESIGMRGVRQPIVVRELANRPGFYEIVCGHRRYDASVKAGKSIIPAIISKVSNAEALEIQAIENFQREDLDPVDRGWVVRDMLEQYKKGMTPKDALKRVGERLNCKERTLYNVMMLAQLIPEFQEMLREGSITASHGYEIGPFSPDAQKELLKEINQQIKWHGVPSVRRLKEILREAMYWPLDGAPWNKANITLLAGAGACNDCPKNTAVNALLIPGEKKAVCTDRVCFKQKLHNQIVQIEKTEKAVRLVTTYDYKNPAGASTAYRERDYKLAKKDSCPHVVTGVIVDGREAGHTRLVCITKKCTVHFQSWERSGGSDYGRSNPRVSPAAIKSKMRSNKLNLAVRTKLSETMRTGVKKLEQEDLKVAACVMFKGLQHNLQAPLIGTMGWRGANNAYGYGNDALVARHVNEMKPAELASFIAMMCCVHEVVPGIPDYLNNETRRLADFDKRHKIGLEKVRDQVTKEMRAKFAEIYKRRQAKEKKPKLQTSAKKKKAKAA